MARKSPTKGKGPKSDWGGWGSKQAYENAIKSGQVKTETMAGGNLKSLLVSAATRLAAPARSKARDIGEFVAEHSGQSRTYVARGARTQKVSGDVYTPQGVFKGKDVFVSKPPVSPDKAAAVQKGLDTRARRELARQTRIGARGAVYGGIAGGATVAGAYELGGTVKKVVKKARGGGTKKK